MARGRKRALERLNGLAARVQEHLEKLSAEPDAWDVSHWKGEIKNWLNQMDKLIPQLGKKTGQLWAEPIAHWRSQAEM